MNELVSFDDFGDSCVHEELFLRDYDGDRAAALFEYFGARMAEPRVLLGSGLWRGNGAEGALRFLDVLERREGRTAE